MRYGRPRPPPDGGGQASDSWRRRRHRLGADIHDRLNVGVVSVRMADRWISRDSIIQARGERLARRTAKGTKLWRRCSLRRRSFNMFNRESIDGRVNPAVFTRDSRLTESLLCFPDLLQEATITRWAFRKCHSLSRFTARPHKTLRNATDRSPVTGTPPTTPVPTECLDHITNSGI